MGVTATECGYEAVKKYLCFLGKAALTFVNKSYLWSCTIT